MTPSREQRTLEVVCQVAAVLSRRGIDSALIGALAVAVHGYPRATRDADLATDVDPFTQLRDVADDLRREGFEVEQNSPDAEDPLGGLITVSGDDFNDVQIVNFSNPYRPGSLNPGGDAIRTAIEKVIRGKPLRVVDLAHLIALQLYAGGPKRKLDVIELLTRNPAADLKHIREVCARYELADAFDALRDQLSLSG